MKTEKVTRKKLNDGYHYRAQVQLPDKFVWAICYGSISDRNPEVAGELRDALSGAISQIVVDHFRTLISEPSFRNYFEQWLSNQVDDELKPAVRLWLDKVINEALLPR